MKKWLYYTKDEKLRVRDEDTRSIFIRIREYRLSEQERKYFNHLKGENTMAKVITAENFEEEVLKAEGAVLVDFWATWCGPCKRQGPIVDELAEEGYNVGKLDVDQNMPIAQQYKVQGVPTLMVFKNGQEVERFVGITPKEKLIAVLEG